jgi:hypothetical protein
MSSRCHFENAANECHGSEPEENSGLLQILAAALASDANQHWRSRALSCAGVVRKTSDYIQDFNDYFK